MQRDPSTGRIVPDPSKFPNGISGVADQVHALGLKFGIYRWVSWARNAHATEEASLTLLDWQCS